MHFRSAPSVASNNAVCGRGRDTEVASKFGVGHFGAPRAEVIYLRLGKRRSPMALATTNGSVSRLVGDVFSMRRVAKIREATVVSSTVAMGRLVTRRRGSNKCQQHDLVHQQPATSNPQLEIARFVWARPKNHSPPSRPHPIPVRHDPLQRPNPAFVASFISGVARDRFPCVNHAEIITQSAMRQKVLAP